MHGCAAPPSWPLEEFDAPVAKAQPDEETVVTRAPISWPCRMLPAERPAGVLACVAGRHLDAADCAKLFGSNWDLAPMSDAQLTYLAIDRSRGLDILMPLGPEPGNLRPRALPSRRAEANPSYRLNDP